MKSHEERFKEYLMEEKYTDGSSSELVYIHIGKCGGATLHQALIESPVIRRKFSSIRYVHVRKPYYRKYSSYLVVVRNPVSRVLSAFNWRYKLVVETKEQEFRFAGEYEVLEKYECLNNLAEALYCNHELNLSAVKDWLTVHHLKEDIAFYLSDLLNSLRRDQLFAVITQEYLNLDIERLLNVKHDKTIQAHKSTADERMLYLSNSARDNLKRFLDADYDAIKRLSELYTFEPNALEELIQ